MVNIGVDIIAPKPWRCCWLRLDSVRWGYMDPIATSHWLPDSRLQSIASNEYCFGKRSCLEPQDDLNSMKTPTVSFVVPCYK